MYVAILAAKTLVKHGLHQSAVILSIIKVTTGGCVLKKELTGVTVGADANPCHTLNPNPSSIQDPGQLFACFLNLKVAINYLKEKTKAR